MPGRLLWQGVGRDLHGRSWDQYRKERIAGATDRQEGTRFQAVFHSEEAHRKCDQVAHQPEDMTEEMDHMQEALSYPAQRKNGETEEQLLAQ